MLKIFNSLTGTKETFRPIEAGKVSIYVCGITVYDYCHLGHARAYIVFDVVTRYLNQHVGAAASFITRFVTAAPPPVTARLLYGGPCP